ncbi:MAG: hypothetical protein JNK74_28880, partial [Candidatus Hydrogenedentes bacterium]|nr:hypothetical protein [Candidatus Hydrogenedentota bacterium]
SLDDIKGDYPWPHAYFILVSREHVKCLTYAQLKAGRSFAPDCGHYLIKRTELKLDRELIVRFGQLAKRFFAGV